VADSRGGEGGGVEAAALLLAQLKKRPFSM